MPARSQIRIRRDLNRLSKLLEEHAASNPALEAVRVDVDAVTTEVNERFQEYQQSAVAGDQERKERDEAIGQLRGWVQRWRPVVLLKVAGAAESLQRLPASGATPDDQIRVAQDLGKLIERNPAAESFREAALTELGEQIELARKEMDEATSALPAEAGAREALTEATLAGNEVLVRVLEIVRAIFGPKSTEYKRFVTRSSEEEEAEEDEEAEVGEGSEGEAASAN